MHPSTQHSTMSASDAPNLVVARLLDYFGRRTDWQRRLWNPGTVTVLQETLEAVDLLDSGHLRTGTATELVKMARRRAGPDLGVGTEAVRTTVEATLGTLQKAANGQSDPLRLVARARTALKMCGQQGGPKVWDLLGH